MQLAPGPRDPVHAFTELDTDRGPVTTDGTVSNLPRHAVSYSPSQGKVVYNAYGETIDSADTTVDAQNVLFGRVKHIYGASAVCLQR